MKNSYFHQKRHLILSLVGSVLLLSINPAFAWQSDLEPLVIPDNAVEKVFPQKPTGDCEANYYRYTVDGELLCVRHYYRQENRYSKRKVYSETRFKNGVRQKSLKFHPDGSVFEELPYFNNRGLLDGPCRYWSPEGKIISSSILREGSGFLRKLNKDGSPDCEYYLQDGLKQGMHKDWLTYSHGDAIIPGYVIKTYEADRAQGWSRFYSLKHILLSESMMQDNHLHGVLRNWDRKGNMLEGYPRYFINGKEVTQATLETAAEQDPVLKRSLNSVSHTKAVSK